MDTTLGKFKLFIATLSVSIGTLLISLDQFIANVSIPTIAGDLGISQDDGTWVITSYTIANAIVVPLTGWLTSLFGRVRLFCLSAILFAIMSLACGLAISFPMLIAFRVLQGLVSGTLIPLSQALLLLLYPKKKGFAMGMWGLVVMVGPALGPVLGGWITDNINWRWIFYINVPLGVLAGIITYVLLSHHESERKKMPLDLIGIFLLVITVGAYQVMLDRGNDDDWFNSTFIIALAITAFIGFCFLLVWEHFHNYPVIDLTFFKSRNFVLGSFTMGIAAFIVFGSLIVSPLWVQAQLGYTPLWAGYSISLFGLSAIVVFPLVGIYLHLLDERIWTALGFLFMIPPFFYLAYIPIWSSFGGIAWPRFYQGIGFAMMYVALTSLTLTGIPNEKIPSAAGIFSFIRMIFISGGVSLSTNYFVRRENFYQSRYVESIIPSNPQYFPYYEAVETGLNLEGLHADAFVDQMVMNQAYTQVFLEMSYLSALGFIVLFFLMFFFRSPKEARERAEQIS